MAGEAMQQWGSRHMEVKRCEAPVLPLGMLSSTASPAGGTQLCPGTPATELSPGKDTSPAGYPGHWHFEMPHN